MNIQLTSEQVEFVERAIASGQCGSAEEVLSQVWAIGTKEVEARIAIEAGMRRLGEFREQALARIPCEDAAVVEKQATEFVEEIEQTRRRSQYLRECFGELIE